MQKKKWVTIVLSVLLFISIGILGVANVYRVDEVSVRATTISQDAKDEAAQLQAELQGIYTEEMGSNMLFVNQEPADIALAKYPYFRITSFTKEFPNRIVIEVKEDEEMFAVQTGEKYRILSADGVYLSERNSVEGRSQKPNIIVTGLTVAVGLGDVVSGNDMATGFVEAVKAMAAVPGMGGSLRGNVVAIDVSMPAPSEGLTMLTFTMKEGATARIYNFSKRTQEKVEKLMETYLQMDDQQKVTGDIRVDEIGGQIVVG